MISRLTTTLTVTLDTGRGQTLHRSGAAILDGAGYRQDPNVQSFIRGAYAAAIGMVFVK